MLDILYYPQFDPQNEGKLNLQVLQLSAILVGAFLVLLLNNPIFGEKTRRITNISIVYGSYLLGITLFGLISPEENLFLYIIIKDGAWLIIFEPLYLTQLFLFGLMILFSIVSAVQHLRKYNELIIIQQYFEIFSAIAIVLFLSALIYDWTITSSISIALFFMGFLFLILATIFLIRNVKNHPLTSVYLKKSTASLFSQDQISYILYSIKDDGPTLLFQSENLEEKKDISKQELYKFGVQALMLAYNENKYIENVAISPFAAREEYFALSVSFVAQDQELMDNRFDNKSQSVLVILVPRDVFINFSKPLKNVRKINEVVKRLDLREKDLSEITNDQFLEHMSHLILNVIF